jgi:hypothetical protein
MSDVKLMNTSSVVAKEKVHLICALSLPEVFQYSKYSTKPSFTLDIDRFPIATSKTLIFPNGLDRKDSEG